MIELFKLDIEAMIGRNRYGKPQRPETWLCQHTAGIKRCFRHFRSLNKGRISVDECKRRLKVNYKRTGAYTGPLGWCD